MTVGILTEKPSAQRNFAKALGGVSGSFNGENYVIVAARGHLFEFEKPAQQVTKSLESRYTSWAIKNLPWNQRDFKWKRKPSYGVSKTLSEISSKLNRCDEIVIATDVDPSGEGGLLAWEILDELGLTSKKISRMYFTDEAPASIQKAFKSRKQLSSMQNHDEFRMAWLRQRWDFLSMQWTRIATALAPNRPILRQGRLKSAMVVLAGDQIKAHDSWKKVPFYEPRFRDENGVMYVDANIERKAKREEVNISGLHESSVTIDSRKMMHSSPPRMLDLAGLSSILSGRGVKAADVLSTYQRMYENQVVSYPRTEDKTITYEQFDELCRNASKIARVIGIDPKLLTHTAARSTHVKNVGAHGANRPGPNVPDSLEDVRQSYGDLGAQIYELLARSALSILAEDYQYEQQKGHVTDFPTYLGSVKVPKYPGWKIVLGQASLDDDEDDTSRGLGKVATPYVHEVVPPRPGMPTMKWLMKQLERREVGTGATRTSTFSDISEKGSNPESTRYRYPLFDVKRGQISLTEFGKLSYQLLPGTHIGNLVTTERVFEDMRAVAAGKKDAEAILDQVAQLIIDDVNTMKSNSNLIRKESGMSEYQEAEYFEGTFKPENKQVKFKRVWSGHRFTDDECMKLLDGEEIEITAKSNRTGKNFRTWGSLQEQDFKGRTYIGFKANFNKQASQTEPPEEICQVKFTKDQRDRLANGERVEVKGMMSKKGKKFDSVLSWTPQGGIKFHFDD